MGGHERSVSYLPLSHVTAQVADIYMPIHTASTVYFAQPDALKGSIVETLREVNPTLFPGVPRLAEVYTKSNACDFMVEIESIKYPLTFRVWEKFHERMQAAAAEITGVKKVLGKWAKDVAYQANVDLLNK